MPLSPKLEEERKILREQWGGDAPITQTKYTLQDLFNNKSAQDAAKLQEYFDAFNKQVPKDNQFYPPQAVHRLKQHNVEGLKGTNAEEYTKYFHPNTQVRYDPSSGGYGYVRTGGEDKDINLINIRTAGMQPNEYLETLLHEAGHVDSHNSPRQGYFLGHPVSPLSELLFALEKAGRQNKKYFNAGNSNESVDEVRANMRASLGKAPLGTSFENHFKDLLDAVYTTQKEYPFNRSNTVNAPQYGRYAVTRDQAARALEAEVFPRERWIEPREASWKERVSDFLQMFKR